MIGAVEILIYNHINKNQIKVRPYYKITFYYSFILTGCFS